MAPVDMAPVDMAPVDMTPVDMAVDIVPVAMTASNSLPKYTYYYQKKEAVENDIPYNIFGKFLLQLNKNTDGTTTIIEARTSISLDAAPGDNITDKFNEILKQAYGVDTNIDNLVHTTDLNDLAFKEFLNTLNPIIKLPVKKEVRFFTRALVEYSYAIEQTDIEPTNIKPADIKPIDREISQVIGFIGLAPNQERERDLLYFEDTAILDPANRSKPMRYTLDDINPKYIETTLDAITKSQRLIPIIIEKQIPQNLNEFKSKYTPIITTPLYNENSARSDNILEMINDNFAQHFSFSYPFFQTGIDNIIREIKPAASGLQESPAPESILDTINVNDPIFIIINFLRSYIDLYHDVLHHGKEYCKNLRDEFSKQPLANNDFYKTWIAKIDGSIFTKPGKISQSQCKKLIEELADEFIKMLHNGEIGMRIGSEGAASIKKAYTLIPKNKENANIMSASTDNREQLEKLFKTMEEDGIKGFFVESIDNSFGTKLLQRGFDLCSLTIGEWDAGSGYKGGKEIINKRILIGPAATIDPLGKVLLKSHESKAVKEAALTLSTINIPNESINIFNIININVMPDNKILNVKYAGGEFNIPGPQELSLNKIFKTTNNKIIRGLQDKKVGDIITDPQITPKDQDDLKKSLIALKTWTDLIQIVTISKSMTPRPDSNPLKILTVINDNLCESTARMYGLGHVLKSQNKIVTYYNYNINSRILSTLEQNKKNGLKRYIADNYGVFEDYITRWFNQRIKALNDIYETFYDPVFYFICKLFIENYKTAREKAILILNGISGTDVKLIPDTIDEYIESITSSAVLLGDLLNYVSKFNLAIERITKLHSRLPIENFFEAYDYVEQQISNTFKEAEPRKLRAMIASTFAYVFIKQYNSSRYILMLDEFNKSLLAIDKRLNDINDIKTAYTILSELKPLTNSTGKPVHNNSSNYGVSATNYDINPTKKRKRSTNTVNTRATKKIIRIPINYTYYITEMVDRPFIGIQKEWAFSNIITKVEAGIVAVAEAGAVAEVGEAEVGEAEVAAEVAAVAAAGNNTNNDMVEVRATGAVTGNNTTSSMSDINTGINIETKKLNRPQKRRRIGGDLNRTRKRTKIYGRLNRTHKRKYRTYRKHRKQNTHKKR